LKRCYGSRVIVELVDVASLLPPPWCFAAEIYAWMGQHPAVYERMWKTDDSNTDFRNSSQYSNIRWNSIKHVRSWVEAKLVAGTEVFLSVHPLCNHLPLDALEQLKSAQRGKYSFRFVTVVTDLGTAHLSWFDPRADAIFVPTRQLRERALALGVRDERLHVFGLPVRESFWDPVVVPKDQWRQRLGLVPEGCCAKKLLVVLLMGGGEGFGELESIAVTVGSELGSKRLGKLVVACGRNEATRSNLESYPWPCPEWAPEILGFTTNIFEYMCASNVLITKAGPGSIAEAMIVGLPCLLTSFLPGQEEGNVPYVVDAGAGAFVSDLDPQQVASKLVEWLQDPLALETMSACALKLARPQATLDIAQYLGSQVMQLGPPGGSSKGETTTALQAACADCSLGLKLLVAGNARQRCLTGRGSAQALPVFSPAPSSASEATLGKQANGGRA